MTDAPLTPAQIAQNEAQAAREGYIHRVLVAFDQFWNVAAGGLPDETISSHVRRDVDEHKHNILATILNHLLDTIQPDHGARAEAGDLQRAEEVAKTEQEALQQ